MWVSSDVLTLGSTYFLDYVVTAWGRKRKRKLYHHTINENLCIFGRDGGRQESSWLKPKMCIYVCCLITFNSSGFSSSFNSVVSAKQNRKRASAVDMGKAERSIRICPTSKMRKSNTWCVHFVDYIILHSLIHTTACVPFRTQILAEQQFCVHPFLFPALFHIDGIPN